MMVIMDYPKRKPTRIPGYDYAKCNYYFITVCTHDKSCIFGKVNKLNKLGKIAEESLKYIQECYTHVFVDKYVIMPNHVHAIIVTEPENKKTLTGIIGQYKMSVTKKIRVVHPEMQVWQRSFHDHIIRNQKDYERIWTYIENNPEKWKEDCFYQKTEDN